MLRNVVIENRVYQDLLQKKAKGSSLEDHEQAFMKQHVSDLKQHGLFMGQKGLQKINPAQMQTQQMQR